MLNLNTPNKQWNMYLNTLSSISGDDLTIKPDTRRNLLLEVSGNNNIIIKRGNVSYNLTNLITGDTSFSNFDISNNINPVTNNNGSLGTSNKLWGNAYIRDISVTNMSVSGTISTFREIIPQNDISTSLGNSSNMWQKAFIRDLSGITRINGTAWPIIGPTGTPGGPGPSGSPGGPGPSGSPGPPGPTGALVVSINTTLTDISNLRITTKNRIYQEISGGINDLSWTSVNGYYGLAKDAYPSLNPLSSGDLAVKTWTLRNIPTNFSSGYILGVAWSPSLRIFAAVGQGTSNAKTLYSYDGINWFLGSMITSLGGTGCNTICWSPELRIFVALAGEGSNSNDYKVMTSTDGINWTERATPSSVRQAWFNDVCWSPELSIFVAVSSFSPGAIVTSPDGINWAQSSLSNIVVGRYPGVCWSPQLGIFVAIEYTGTGVITSKDGKTWNKHIHENTALQGNYWYSVCWSAELGLFVAVANSGTYRIITSTNGTRWIPVNQFTGETFYFVDWIPHLRLFIALSQFTNSVQIVTSPDGINWTQRNVPSPGGWAAGCWSPELGIYVAIAPGPLTGYNGPSKIITSSLKGRPPTSYNVFDSSFNRIDENGKWDFSNINVTTLTANGASVSSDDRLKHNEIVINNGLDIIDQLSPKFYQKTQVLLDAHYNGDLSGYAWTLEAGLIAQELLQISDLSFTVGGGDYYEQTYKYITQTNDLSNSYYDLSNSYYEPSANNYELRYNYYDLSKTNYEISYNLIAQPYNVNYNSVFIYGLAAIKELHAKVKAQESMLLNQKNIINSLLARIQVLEK